MCQVYGQGTLSCGRWVEENRAGRDPNLYIWMVGFVSKAGYASSTPQRKTDSDAMAVRIDQYCAANPLGNIAKATGMLVLELERKQ
jgi:hypothetical protein